MLDFVLFFVFAIAAVILGTKTKVNMGLWAYLFAFILGLFRAGMSVAGVIGLFPASVYYALLSSALFFGFATNNGAMDLLARKLMWSFRKQVWMGPLVMFVVASVVSLCGCNGTTGLILSGMCYSVAAAMGCNIMPILIVVGCAAGGWGMFPWGSAGAINFSSFSQYNDQAVAYAGGYLGGTIAVVCELICALYFCFKTGAFKKRDTKELDIMQQPEPFNKKQKITIATIFIVLALIVIPTLLNVFFKTAFTKRLTGIFSVYTVWTLGIIILGLIGIGDIKELVTKRVSWNAVVLVTGMSTLFGMAQKIGVVERLGSLLNNLPSVLVVPMLAGICGVLSFFVSGTIVTPFFSPMVAAFVEASGHSSGLVAAAIIAGAVVTSISPVSSGGAYLLSAAPTDEISTEGRNGLFKAAFINEVLIIIIFFILQLFM